MSILRLDLAQARVFSEWRHTTRRGLRRKGGGDLNPSGDELRMPSAFDRVRRRAQRTSGMVMLASALAVITACGPHGMPLRETLQIAPAKGPLRVSTLNPRYFSDGSGKIIFLTGSHTWNNFQDWGTADPPPPFDYTGYLSYLSAHSLNFYRLWT